MDDPGDERVLIESVKNSDVESFRLLFQKSQPIVFRRLLFQTGDADLSHDLVQETFLRIWERRSSLKPHLSFTAYALTISQNLLRDALRTRRTHARIEKTIPPPALSENDNPSEALNLSRLQEQLTFVINEKLPEKCRTVLLLSRFERLSNREIAEMLGISVRTVENQINHALKILRKYLREQR